MPPLSSSSPELVMNIILHGGLNFVLFEVAKCRGIKLRLNKKFHYNVYCLSDELLIIKLLLKTELCGHPFGEISRKP